MSAMERTAWDPEGVDTFLDPDGKLSDASAASQIDLRSLYKKLVGARALDLRLGRMGLPMWASGAGEEAPVVSLGLQLERSDWVYPGGRDAALPLARGVSAQDIASKALDHAHLRGPSGSFAFPEANIAHGADALGMHLALAAGHARSQMLGGDGICAALCGEGLTTMGVFHETLSIAAHGDLPLVVVCKSQVWPDGPPAEAGVLGDTVAERVQTLGVWTRRTDGADPVATHRAIGAALARARSGAGPALVEVVVTQMHHEPPPRRDPIERLRRLLDAMGEWSQTFQDIIEAEIRGHVDKAEADAAEEVNQ